MFLCTYRISGDWNPCKSLFLKFVNFFISGWRQIIPTIWYLLLHIFWHTVGWRMGEVIVLSFHRYQKIYTVVSMICYTHYLDPCIREYWLPPSHVQIFCLGFMNREIELIGFLLLRYSSSFFKTSLIFCSIIRLRLITVSVKKLLRYFSSWK